MPSERTGYAPWSLTREAGVESATVDGTIQVPQNIQPVLDCGFVDEKGDWKGLKSSDKVFRAFSIDEGIPNGGEILTPTANADGSWPLNMTGFQHLLIAIKTTEGGNYAITAVMGPDTISYANLNPVNPAATLRGNRGFDQGFSDVLVDSADSLTANVWNIFMISNNLHDQKHLQFKIVNNSGSEAKIECAYLRIVE